MPADNSEVVIIRVNMDVDYYVPMVPGTDQTKINGWTVDEVKKDWFEDFNINHSHASRDNHQLGNGKVIQGITSFRYPKDEPEAETKKPPTVGDAAS